MAHKEMFIGWLNDAHATEKALIPILEEHAEAAKNHPELQQRLQQHLETTKRHAEMVKECIERLGGNVSETKSAIGSMFGTMKSMSSGMASNEMVKKNSIADYAAEHFEIASYKSLMASAEEMGDQETARICREILRDEEGMASWLDQHMPMVVREAMREKAAT